MVSGFWVSWFHGFMVSWFQGFIGVGIAIAIGIVDPRLATFDPRRSTGTPAFPTPQVAFQGFMVSRFLVSRFQGFWVSSKSGSGSGSLSGSRVDIRSDGRSGRPCPAWQGGFPANRRRAMRTLRGCVPTGWRMPWVHRKTQSLRGFARTLPVQLLLLGSMPLGCWCRACHR